MNTADPLPFDPLTHRLRRLRQERGWTLRELSERLRPHAGLSIHYLSELERIPVPSVSLSILGSIAEAYGIMIGDLLKGTEYSTTWDSYHEGFNAGYRHALTVLRLDIDRLAVSVPVEPLSS